MRLMLPHSYLKDLCSRKPTIHLKSRLASRKMVLSSIKGEGGEFLLKITCGINGTQKRYDERNRSTEVFIWFN